jgi:hypothetical protein
MNSKAHQTTVYILRDNSGRLHMYSYRPTDSYAGRSDRDQYSLAQGLHMENPSHDTQLGVTNCRIVTGTHSGLQSKNITATVIAKRSFVWDYSLPMGQRETNAVATAEWDSVLKQYQAQARK